MNLTASQAQVLAVLSKTEAMCNRDVAERAQLSPGWTSEVLRALERKGLARGAKKKDRRDPHTHWMMWRKL